MHRDLQSGMPNITVNGQPRQVPEGRTVEGLLADLKMAGSPCAVEVNRALVPKRQHAQRTLCDGDSVEIVTLVGGG
jgi:sulfur carrier protein